MKVDIGTDKIIAELKKKESEREGCNQVAREIVRECSLAINHIHCKEFEKSLEKIKGARELLQKNSGSKYIDLFNQAKQEYCEAFALYQIVVRGKLPAKAEIGVETEPYLTGLCDCAGELRREMLASLMKKELKKAQYYFDMMDALHQAMLPIRFTNSVLPGFRVKQDVLRKQLELARSELFQAMLTYGKTEKL